MVVSRLIILLILISPLVTAQSTEDSIQQKPDRKRLRTVALAGGGGYAITLVGLNELWYKNSPRQSFQFFNDSREWMQVDKLGHFYSAFYLSMGTSKAYQWCGIQESKADLFGAITGFMIMLPIEIFDGFSAAYGASGADLVANAGGSLFYLGQKKVWNEVRLYPKFSFHRTNFPSQRPDVLGDNLISEIVKDYNGQTYWLSVDMDKFITFPKWLNIAVGYGAHEMIYAHEASNRAAGYSPHRQFYLSLDPDLTAIRTNSGILKTLFSVLSLIKLPSPTVSLSSGKTEFHVLY